MFPVNPPSSQPRFVIAAKFVAVSLLTFSFLLLLSIIYTSSREYFDPGSQKVKIIIRDGKITLPGEGIAVDLGKKVTLKIDSDIDEQFHIEGYHAFARLVAGRETKLTFEALTPGSFPVYLDKSKTLLGRIEVKHSK